MNRAVRILRDPVALTRAAAEEFVRCAEQSVAARGVFTVALSGGSTPKSLYQLLASEPYRRQIPWDKIHFFWGDERQVPPVDPESNYRMAYEALLARVPVLPQNVHRIEAEDPEADKAAEKYEQKLREVFGLNIAQLPRFDLVLLGMGPCGHTSSLFPYAAALHETSRLVVATWVERFKAYRITLTPQVLNNASVVMFLVSGRDKAETLQAVLEGGDDPERYPAQLVQPGAGTLLWMVDEEAAARLKQKKIGHTGKLDDPQ